MLFIAHVCSYNFNMHGQPPSGARCLDFVPLYVIQVPTLCVQALGLQVNFISREVSHVCFKSSFRYKCGRAVVQW